ncbi:MAG: alpha-2-macroglobulin [Deltaproteobacteria bacterium]|nr:alpha-2-macroglobulin [Deltaproteobacteria bacterium]
MSRRHGCLRSVSAALVLTVTACSQCGRSDRRLKPLPAPPALDLKASSTASAPLKVVIATPTQPDQHGEVRPAVTFSKPIVALGAVEQMQRRLPMIAVEPPVAGEWKWIGSSTVEFAPRDRLPLATAFKLTVAAGVTALDGSRLAQPFSWQFSTVKPELRSVEPDDRWAWLRPDQVFELRFNQRVRDLAQHVALQVGDHPLGVDLVKEIDERAEAIARRKEHRRPAQLEVWELRRLGFRYQIKAKQPLPLDREVVLTVAADLAGVEGTLTLGEAKTRDYRSYGPMRIARAEGCRHPTWDDEPRCTHGPIVLVLSNRADVKTLKPLLSIEPKVEINWAGVESYLPESRDCGYRDCSPFVTLPGRYQAGVRYTIKVAAGLVDEFGQKAPAFEGQVQLDDLRPTFRLGPGQALLEAERDGALPIESANVKRGEFDLWLLTPAEMAQALSSLDSGQREPAPPNRAPLHLGLDLRGTRNALRWTPLKLREALPEGKRSGLFFVQGWSPDLPFDRGPRPKQYVLAQITDLAVHTKLGPKSGVAWVTRLSTGKPVGGAELTLFDAKGARRWSGTSDASGVARVPGTVELLGEDPKKPWSIPFALVAARLDDDVGVTLSTWQGDLSPWAFSLDGEWASRRPDGLGALFSERGIYRPGEQVHVKGVLRYRSVGDLRNPAGAPVTLVIEDSRGKEIERRSVKLSAYGTFATTVEIGAEAPLGYYGMTARAAVLGTKLETRGQFRVAEFRPPPFQVDVTAPAAQLIAGERIRAQVAARYLFGAAMAQAGAHWTAVRRSTDFEPPGEPAFAFGVRTWWGGDDEPAASSGTFGGGDAVTDAEGAFAVDVGVAEAPANRTWEYTVEAEVADVSRQRVANRATVTVHPAAYYAGVKPASEGFGVVGEPARVELIACKPDGERQAKVAIDLKVKRRVWKSIRQKGSGGEYFTDSEPEETVVHSCQVRTEATPVVCEFKPEKGGLHVLEATLKDEQGRQQTTRTGFYVVGDGWASWQRTDSDHVDLVPDRRSYRVGDVAKVLVKSPYPEADALLSVERAGVLSTRLVHLTGSAVALEVPIGEEMVPNVYVGVVIARGRVGKEQGIEVGDDPGRPAVRIGYTELKVDKQSKRLAVSVQADAENKRPRDKVRLELKVSDHRGQGRPAELTVWAVNESVLRLTGYRLPDLVERIIQPFSLSVRIGEPLIHLVLARVYGEKGASPGGGGGGDFVGSELRSRFKTTPLFEPSVITDEHGVARLEFELPDNLTTYRIMALATTKGDQFGAGETRVVVSKPLLARPAMPRIARVGDKIEAGVVVQTVGAAIDSAEVSVEARGLTLTGPAQRTVSVQGGTPVEVRFAFIAERAGTADLVFKVRGGSESDAVLERIPVLLPVSLEAVAAYGDTADRSSEGLVPPGGVRPGVGGLEISLASTALGNFDEGMRQLVRYPYGCLEQLASRLVPFIALRELYGAFGVPYSGADGAEEDARAEPAVPDWLRGVDLAGITDPDEIVRRTVRAIEQLQTEQGGFRYWPESRCADPWASAYALLALARAAEVQYPVRSDVLDKAKSYLSGTVAAGKCSDCGFGCWPPDDGTRVFALYALARAGAAVPSYYPELFARRAGLSLSTRAMLANAILNGGGDTAQGQRLLDEIMSNAKQSPADVHFEQSAVSPWEGIFNSHGRTTALVLETLVRREPSHPFVAKMAHYLGTVRRGDGTFRSTQEAAFALIALTEVVRAKEREAPDFVGTVMLGGQALVSEPFRGRDLAVRRTLVPVDKLGAAGSQLPLVFSKQGQGVLYYGALLRYAPSALPTDPLDQGIAVQRWFEPLAGGGQADSFAAGELVRVRLRVASASERNYVVVDVPLPAGLEAVDPSLASSAQNRAADGEEDEDDEGDEADDSPYRYAFYSPWSHVEQRDDRVLYFADRLLPGIHEVSFVARATTPGDFVLKPAQAEEMYAPEVFGRSRGGRFAVTVGEGK